MRYQFLTQMSLSQLRDTVSLVTATRPHPNSTCLKYLTWEVSQSDAEPPPRVP